MKTPHPDTPCVARCSTALGDEICQGCGRTFLEVANWSTLSEEEKELVWLRLQSKQPPSVPKANEMGDELK